MNKDTNKFINNDPVSTISCELKLMSKIEKCLTLQIGEAKHAGRNDEVSKLVNARERMRKNVRDLEQKQLQQPLATYMRELCTS